MDMNETQVEDTVEVKGVVNADIKQNSPKKRFFIISLFCLGFFLLAVFVLNFDTKERDANIVEYLSADENLIQEYNTKYNPHNRDFLSAGIEEGVKTYYDFPYIKKFWSDSAVVKPSIYGEFNQDIFVRFTNASRTPELVDFAHGNNVEGENYGTGYMGSNLHFAEQYVGDINNLPDYVGRVWLKKTPEIVYTVRLQPSEHVIKKLESKFEVASIDELYVSYKFEQWDTQGLLHYLAAYRDEEPEIIYGARYGYSSNVYFVDYVSVSHNTPWILVPLSSSQNEGAKEGITVSFSGNDDTFAFSDVNEIAVSVPSTTLAKKYKSSYAEFTIVDIEDRERCSLTYTPTPFVSSPIYLERNNTGGNSCMKRIASLFDEDTKRSEFGLYYPTEEFQVKAVLYDKLEKGEIIDVLYSQPFTITEADNTIGDSELSHFVDPYAGISFNYPTRLKSIYVEGGNMRTYAFGGERGATFLVLENATSAAVSYERGAYWGDAASDVTEDYLSDCQQSEVCTVYTNPHGVIFAKYTDKSFDWRYNDEDIPLSNKYKLYNPTADHYGIILSDIRLDLTFQEEFKETVIDSFKLLGN